MNFGLIYGWVLLAFFGLFVVGIIICMLLLLHQSRYRRFEDNKVIIEDEEEIDKLISAYTGDEILEIHHVRNLNKRYIELIKRKNYKANPKDPTYMEEISEEILKVDYYIKL